MRSWISSARAQAVLLDLDGVLLDSRGLHDAALVEGWAECCGKPAPEPLPWVDEGLRSSEKLQLLGTKDRLDHYIIRAYKARRYLELLDDGRQRWHSPARLRASLQGLAAVALVTSFTWEGGLARVLSLMGLVGGGDPFDQIFAPYDGDTAKDALYSAAASWLTRCKHLPLKEVLVLEDSDAAILGATAAGFTKVRKTTYEQLGATL